ncbi:acyltransferase family protein [Bacillus sp. FJAT-29790]|uniref:acyltransferase family protein n=1 Tax=Bacillus sp. FJAT-29790 TaxID=1895002 RepID=UPI001C2371EB|nr:acyltransferase family protein [Bacillus sp. FJAT-29790]
MGKPVVKEIYFIRVIACLSVVMIHAITMVTVNFELPLKTITFYRIIQMLLLFATPIFILISEFLLAYSYPDHIPKGFFKKRLMFILIPYFSMSVIYAVVDKLVLNPSIIGILKLTYKHIFLANWHGYFIMIIFQFYILHYIFLKYFQKTPASIVLTVSFIINAGYLYIFSFVPPPEGINGNFWYSYSRLSFLGWLFYFTVAYYCGRNILKFRILLNKYKYWIGVFLFASVSYVLYSYLSGTLTMVSSKRFDLISYTIAVFLALFYASQKIKHLPKPILLLSKYSFAIYLLHPMIQFFLNLFLPEKIHIGLYTILAFSIGVAGSILFAYMIHKLPFGKFIVGNISTGRLSGLKTAKKRERSQSA